LHFPNSVWAEFPERAHQSLLGHLRREFLDLQVAQIVAELDGSEGFGDLAYVQASWALRLAGETGCAEPVRFGVKDLFEAELKIPDDLVRHEIHLWRQRTCGGTFSALIAKAEILAAYSFDLAK
jgi:hypothetical protein